MEAVTPTQAAIQALDALVRPPPPARDRVRLACPACHVTGCLRIDPDHVRVMAIAGGGVMQLRVHPGDICEHGFTVHVDAHMKARCAYK